MGHLGVWMTHVWPLGPDALQSGGGGGSGARAAPARQSAVGSEEGVCNVGSRRPI